MKGAVKAAAHDAGNRDGNHAGYFPTTPKWYESLRDHGHAMTG
jgi:hypothetical protein